MTVGMRIQPHLPDSDPALIAATDQLAGSILFLKLDLNGSAGADCAATLPSWRPGQHNGFSEPTAGWGRPSDVRVRRGPDGAPHMLVADSYGLAAVVGPDGGRMWSVDVGAASNPHAAELLPDGSVVVAASTGGWVRFYEIGEGRRGESFLQWDLVSAHGVLWDPQREVVWVLGNDVLCSLRVESVRGARRIAQISCDPLPSRGGHDLQPVHADSDLLWVTTWMAVYQYSKRERSWSTTYPWSQSLNRAYVKSVGSNPLTGHILQTVPKRGLEPDWVTDGVDVFTPDKCRIQLEGHVYKARYWVADYQ